MLFRSGQHDPRADCVDPDRRQVGRQPARQVLDLAPIRVNAVCPGVVLTERWAKASPEMIRQFTERQLLPRGAEPFEVAQAYLYLMRGGYTTGQVIIVDGGAMLV